jgi:diguanylate cyclase (GGDEF)-like protein/PAS domain S-box-containing protein
MQMKLKTFTGRSLKTRVTLFTLAIFLLCMSLLALYSREVLRQTMQRSLGTQQFSTASFIASSISHELDDRLQALGGIARTITPAILADPAALGAMLQQRPALQAQFDGRTFFAGTDGAVTTSAVLRADNGEPGFADAALVGAALKGNAAIGRPFVRIKSSAPMVGIAVPIRDARGRVIGALGAVLDLGKSNFWGQLADNNYREAGSYLLIAPQHRLVLNATDRNRIMETLPARGADRLADRLIDGAEGYWALVDPAGVAMLASAKGIPLAGWRVVLSLPTEATFGPFHSARARILLAALLLSLLGAALTWLVLRRQLAPMLAAAGMLAADTDADLPMRPLPVGRDDEIGRLIAAVNRSHAMLRQRQDALTASEERFRCLSDMSADFYWESDVAHRLTQRTESKREVDELVFLQASSLGARRWELPSVAPDEAGWQAHRAMLDAHLPFRHFDIARLRPNGSVHHVAVSGDPLFDGAGAFKGYRGIGSDITERKRIELDLLASEQRLAAVLDGVQSGVVTITERGLVESFNQSAVRMFGYDAHEVVGNNIKMLMPEPYRAGHDGYLGNYQRTGIRKIIGRRREVMGQRKDGSTFPLELGVYEAVLNDSKLFIGSVIDISFRKAAEAELRIAATAFESQQGMMITDANSVILRVNHAFTTITGYTSAQAVGQTPRMLRSGRHGADFYRAMWDTIHRTGGWQGELWGQRRNGEVYPNWLTITAVMDNDGAVTHYVGAQFDITERKRTEDQVRQLAFYDALTGLPNRRLLIDRLSQAIAASARSGCHGAVMFLDLDNFKSLNDTQGHAVGDMLLTEAAARLKRCVRQMDTVARFGGDEFVVMLSHLHADHAASAAHAGAVADKIRASLGAPYRLTLAAADGGATVEHYCTVSVGVALFVGQDASEDEILRWADKAMYQAKQGGRNSVRLYQPGA